MTNETKRFCCDNQCHQGRHCPMNMPAEACTELGHDDPPHTYRPWRSALIEALVAVVAVMAVVACWLVIVWGGR